MSIMHRIFSAFEEKGVRYLHFKSNSDLDKSFQGKADFDVLIDKRKLPDAQSVLIAFAAKRHNPPRYGNYPGVDNWLIFDPDTGVIYHLHLHCQIATGKPLIKDYVIPWSEFLLATRIKDKNFGIYISKPEAELLLLMVRGVVKARPFNLIRSIGWRSALHPSMERERRALIPCCDKKALSDMAAELFGKEDGEFIAIAAASDKLGAAQFLRLSRIVRKSLENSRRMPGAMAQWLTLSDTFKKLLTKRMNRYLGTSLPVKKTWETGGAIIAFVGIDGAGKSTVVGDISRWIGKQMECERHYMGVGDGRTTAYAGALKRAAKTVAKKGAAIDKSKERIYFFKAPYRYLKRLVKLSLVYDVEKNNKKKLIRLNRFRLNGGISVLDRFPQTQMPDKNDGPKAGMYERMLGDNLFTRRFKNKERELLKIADEIRPDVIFRLTVDARTGLMRKGDPINDETVRAHQDKLDSLMSIDYSIGGSRVVDIDTAMVYDEELLTIKKILWEYI